jgi:hypothetical protein
MGDSSIWLIGYPSRREDVPDVSVSQLGAYLGDGPTVCWAVPTKWAIPVRSTVPLSSAIDDLLRPRGPSYTLPTALLAEVQRCSTMTLVTPQAVAFATAPVER